MMEQTTLTNTERRHEYTPSTIPPSPFIKWAGGKRSIMNELTARMPIEYSAYIEPFLGGGAVFFSILPDVASLSDYNADLVTTYNIVKTSPYELIDMLETHKTNNSKEYFYNIRAQQDLTDPMEIAARFVYLNRTCFNGLYRVNRSGGFNVPYGSYKSPDITQKAAILACSAALKTIPISHHSYDEITPTVGDFVYFDPPYYPEDEAYFTSYTKYGFAKDDHIRLRDFAVELCDRGVQVMLSNSNTPTIMELYDLPQFHITPISAPRRISCNANNRTPAKELIITGGYNHETGRIDC